jgi:hypothetical protein
MSASLRQRTESPWPFLTLSRHPGAVTVLGTSDECGMKLAVSAQKLQPRKASRWHLRRLYAPDVSEHAGCCNVSLHQTEAVRAILSKALTLGQSRLELQVASAYPMIKDLIGRAAAFVVDSDGFLAGSGC